VVQTTPITLLFLLLARSLAVLIPNDQYACAEELMERDPNWFSSAVVPRARLPPHPTSPRLANLLRGYSLREDAEEISQRDLEYSESAESLVTRDDEFQFTERDMNTRRISPFVGSPTGSVLKSALQSHL